MNAFTIRHPRGLGAALIGAFALCLSAAAATTGPPTTFGGYYEETTSSTSPDNATPPGDAGSCIIISTGTCYFIFSPVPAGKHLIVTQVSCYLITPGGDLTQATLFALRPNGKLAFRFQHLVINKADTEAYAFNNATLQLYNPGDRPVLQTISSSSAGPSGTCTIGGLIQ